MSHYTEMLGRLTSKKKMRSVMDVLAGFHPS